MMVRTAWAACPRGTPVMLMRDRLDVVFTDEDFTHLYPADGRPGFSPGQLALVSVLQFAENLSDRAAADAVRTRIDWKYRLGLELDDPGFDYSLLSEFRARLAEGDRADQLLQLMLDRPVAAGLLKGRGRQPTDAAQPTSGTHGVERADSGAGIQVGVQGQQRGVGTSLLGHDHRRRWVQDPPVRLPPPPCYQGVGAGEVGDGREAPAEDVLADTGFLALSDHGGQGRDHDLGIAVDGLHIQPVEEFVAVGERLDAGVVEKNTDHAALCSCPRP
nr:transposase [Streptomyces sp. IB201691-2A2]